jgi:hypothetical protein
MDSEVLNAIGTDTLLIRAVDRDKIIVTIDGKMVAEFGRSSSGSRFHADAFHSGALLEILTNHVSRIAGRAGL